MADLKNLPVLIIGAGEMATGVAHRLHRSHFRVLCTERPDPLCVRRRVSFCEAVHDGRAEVEGLSAGLVDDPDGAVRVWNRGGLPVMIDPELNILAEYRPRVIIEASLAKRNAVGLKSDMAPLVIALGPGFQAPEEADAVVETNRGHNLGRVIYAGSAAANTGVPGSIEGFTWQRVLRAPGDGLFETGRNIGDLVAAGDVVGWVAGLEVRAEIDGMIRGLIRPGTEVDQGLKLGDVDPRGAKAHPDLISEKARAIGGAVLECILASLNT